MPNFRLISAKVAEFPLTISAGLLSVFIVQNSALACLIRVHWENLRIFANFPFLGMCFLDVGFLHEFC